MYIDSILMREFRTFKRLSVQFLHPDSCAIPKSDLPKLRNMNLVIGENGSGKTTLLKGIALAALGPAVADSGIFPYCFVRREVGRPTDEGALIKAVFTPSTQDRSARFPDDVSHFESCVRMDHRGDLERLKWVNGDERLWHPIDSNRSDAFFFVGYGTNRRAERVEWVDETARRASSLARARRNMSLFEENYSLLPLSHWLPRYEVGNPGRFKQVRALVNRLLGPGRYRFTGEFENGECIFRHGNVRVPFPVLSDGYRALIGWIGDLLYHVCETCPRGKRLIENEGMVMIDEVDLHIHPGWQMGLLPRLAEQLPRIQFIVTSRSPLLVGSVEWQNVIVARQGRGGGSTLKRFPVDVSRLDADQVLLTELFGLESTRSGSQTRRIRELLRSTRSGDSDAVRSLTAEMSGEQS